MYPIDELLRGAGVSQERLANARVLDRRTLRRLRRGEHVRPSTIRRLAAALGVPVYIVERGIALARAEREAREGGSS